MVLLYYMYFTTGEQVVIVEKFNFYHLENRKFNIHVHVIVCTCVSVLNMYMCISIGYVHVYQY